MIIDIKEIDGDVHISGNVITINKGKIVLADGTVICAGLHDVPVEQQRRTESATNGPAGVVVSGNEQLVAPATMATAVDNLPPSNANDKGEVLCEEFEVGSFDTLTVRSVFNVDFSVGEKSKVVVEAVKDTMEQVLVETNGRALTIDFCPGYVVDPSAEVKVKVVAPRLSQVITYGGAIVNLSTPIKNDGTIMLSSHNASRIIASSLIAQTVYLSSDQGSQLHSYSVSASTAIISKCVEASQIHVKDNASSRNIFITADQASRAFVNNISTESFVCKSSGTARVVLTGTARKVEYGASQQSEINAKDLSAESGKAMSSEIASIFANVHRLDAHATMNSKIKNGNN